MLLRQGNIPGSIEKLRLALKLTPNFAPAHYQLALALRERHDLTRATSEFNRARELDPRFQPPRK